MLDRLLCKLSLKSVIKTSDKLIFEKTETILLKNPSFSVFIKKNELYKYFIERIMLQIDKKIEIFLGNIFLILITEFYLLHALVLPLDNDLTYPGKLQAAKPIVAKE